MITQDFKSGGVAVFHDDGAVVFEMGGGSLSRDDFMEFMPLALHVYHLMLPGPDYPSFLGSVGGSAIQPTINKKRGRPATKSAVAKRGRPRKA